MVIVQTGLPVELVVSPALLVLLPGLDGLGALDYLVLEQAVVGLPLL